MDLTSTIQAKTDQQNSDDYIGGPKTVTINRVVVTKGDQPVHIHLEEFPGKPYRPSKSMRRVLVVGWGADSDAYVGRRLTLYRDPDVMFGGEAVGGIKISHMSHLNGPLLIPLTETRGTKKPHRVQLLKEQAAAAPTIDNDQWSALYAKAQELNIEDVGKWISDQLGRTLQGWQEITVAEAEKLTAELDSMTPPAPAEGETPDG